MITSPTVQAPAPKTAVIVSRNPATGEVLGQVEACDEQRAREAIARARVAQQRWESAGLEYRCKVIERLRDVLLRNADELARLITKETGKVLAESLTFEVLPVVDLAGYFAKRAPNILAPRRISMHLLRYRRSYVHYRPRGVVLVISPWNFPFTIPMGEIIMALVAGNAVIQKPASLTPLVALQARKYFDEAGLDPDLFQVLPGKGALGSRMIEMGVDYVNFTGSTHVGTQVAALCARQLIPCSMELGGNDPAIVCADADLELAAGSIVWGAFANAGQICASIERVYAHRAIYDKLVERIVERASKLRVGNPLDDQVDIGAMTDPAQMQVVEQHIEQALAAGAKVLVGGKRMTGSGQFFLPTVLVDVTDDMDVMKEESFGPLLPIMPVDSDEEALERANHSPYGLSANVYTRDRQRGRRLAERIEAGTVVINDCLITHGCPETPWGGVKKSGLGRVHSDEGLRDLSQAYHVNEPAVPTVVSWSPFWQPYSHKQYERLLAAMRAVFGSGLGPRVEALQSLFRHR